MVRLSDSKGGHWRNLSRGVIFLSLIYVFKSSLDDMGSKTWKTVAPTQDSSKGKRRTTAVQQPRKITGEDGDGAEGSKKGCPKEDGGGEGFLDTWYAGALKKHYKASLIKANNLQK